MADAHCSNCGHEAFFMSPLFPRTPANVAMACRENPCPECREMTMEPVLPDVEEKRATDG